MAIVKCHFCSADAKCFTKFGLFVCLNHEFAKCRFCGKSAEDVDTIGLPVCTFHRNLYFHSSAQSSSSPSGRLHSKQGLPISQGFPTPQGIPMPKQKTSFNPYVSGPKSRGGTSIQCSIVWDPDASVYTMRSGYLEVFISAMKDNIPKDCRHCDFETKVWSIDEPYGEKLAEIAKLLFGENNVKFESRKDVEAKRAASGQSTSTSTGSNGSIGRTSREPIDNVIVRFVRSIPFDSLKKAYLHAIVQMHPDKIPVENVEQKKKATDDFQAFNSLWQRITDPKEGLFK